MELKNSRERGFSLIEVLIAIAIMGTVVSIAALQSVRSQKFRQALLDRASVVAFAEGSTLQAVYSVRKAIRHALQIETSSVRNQILLDAIAGVAAAGTGPGAATLVTKGLSLPMPSGTVQDVDAYKKTARRCQGKADGHAASPSLTASSVYLCFLLKPSSQMPSGIWSGVDTRYPALIELIVNPMVRTTGTAVKFDSLPAVAASSELRLFYSVVWVAEKAGDAPSAVRWFGEERHASIQ